MFSGCHLVRPFIRPSVRPLEGFDQIYHLCALRDDDELIRF